MKAHSVSLLHSNKCKKTFFITSCKAHGRSKSSGVPNFDETSQSTVEIKLLPVSENGRPLFLIYISVSNFA